MTVLDTSRYAVSAGTFPAYFLKRLDEVAAAQMQIDLLLFAQRIAPRFHIACRFVGQEPLCETTAAYNKMMAEILEAHAIGAWNCLASWREARPSVRPGCAGPSSQTILRPSGVWCHRPPLNFCNRRLRVPSPSGFEARRKPSLCKSGARPVRHDAIQ